MNDEEKSLLKWFHDNGFRVSLEVGTKNVSTDPGLPDYLPDHDKKYARVERLTSGGSPQFLRGYTLKMAPSDTTTDSYRRVKELLEADMRKAKEPEDAIQTGLIPRLQEYACPICRSIEWRIAESVFELRGFPGGTMIGTGQVVPVILATCNTCGHMLHFNAIQVGAVKTSGIVEDENQ